MQSEMPWSAGRAKYTYPVALVLLAAIITMTGGSVIATIVVVMIASLLWLIAMASDRMVVQTAVDNAKIMFVAVVDLEGDDEVKIPNVVKIYDSSEE